jgi:hypothetical protein
MGVKSERGGLRLRVSFGSSGKASLSPSASTATVNQGSGQSELNTVQIEETANAGNPTLMTIDSAETAALSSGLGTLPEHEQVLASSSLPASFAASSSSAAAVSIAAHSPLVLESRSDLRLIGPTTLRVRLSPEVARTVRAFRMPAASGLHNAVASTSSSTSLSSSASAIDPLAESSVIVPIALRSSPLAASVALELEHLDLARVSDAPIFIRVRRLPQRPLAWAVLAGPALSRAKLDSMAECNAPLFDLCIGADDGDGDAGHRFDIESDGEDADERTEQCYSSAVDDEVEDEDEEDARAPLRKRRRTSAKPRDVESDEEDEEEVWRPKRGSDKKAKAKAKRRASQRRSRPNDDDDESEESSADEDESEDVSDEEDDDGGYTQRRSGRDKKRKRRTADSSSVSSDEE